MNSKGGRNLKISTGLLLLIYTFLANACPNGFYYDENRKLCVNKNDANFTSEKPYVCVEIIKAMPCLDN